MCKIEALKGSISEKSSVIIADQHKAVINPNYRGLIVFTDCILMLRNVDSFRFIKCNIK